MNRMVARVVVGGIVAIAVLTAIGIFLTPADPQQSFTIGLIGGSVIAAVNWFLEESRRGNI